MVLTIYLYFLLQSINTSKIRDIKGVTEKREGGGGENKKSFGGLGAGVN